MNERKTVSPVMNTKKLWTAPVLKAIVLNSARFTSNGGNNDTQSVRAVS